MRGQRRWRVAIAPTVCVVAVVLTLFAVCGRSRSSQDKQDGTGVADDAPAVWDEGAYEMLEGLFEQDGCIESSPETFLHDIEQGAWRESDFGFVASVYWAEDCALPIAAERLLRSYQHVSGAELVSAGYLDLQGNTWGALVRGADGWVDVLMLSTDDDAVSEARVVRLEPEGI